MKSTSQGVFGLLIMMLVLATGAFATDYYVATDGDDDDPGTIGEPFATIQHAADVMSAGDTCFIRAGTYHEEVAWTTDALTGTEANPVTFTNYQNEEVILDGTESITGTWTQHSGNIYKISFTTDIWQLFDDGEMMIPARWPNHNPSDNFWKQDRDTYWGQGDETKDTNGKMYDDPHDDVDLAATNISMADAMAILNVGSFKTSTRAVNSHTAGSDNFTYDPVLFTFKDKLHYYFIECKLNLLDAEKEWYYDSSADMVYLWSPGGGSPSGTIKGKTQTYAFNVIGCDYIVIKGLKFFSTTFKFDCGENITLEDCEFSYPSCTKRMLGSIAAPDASTLITCNSSVIKSCVFEYTDGHAFYVSGTGNTIENNYIHDIDWSASDLPNLMVTLYTRGSNNIFRFNTAHTCGASAFLDVGDACTVYQNNIYDTGFLQSDGALVQCMVGQTPNVEIKYNWMHDTIKYGARFDGEPGGTDGLMHHNVIKNVDGGLMVKGDYHGIYSNTGLDCDPKNDIIIMEAENFGGNDNTITRNCAAERMGGDRTTDLAIPGTKSNNWNGYDEPDTMRDQLRDPSNFDFRPQSGADLVDAGMVISGITDGYLGTAPDIGAYEYGDTNYWIAGCAFENASSPIPPDNAFNVKTNADLMWQEGRDATSNNVYFGTVSGSLTYEGNQSNNIYDPGTLSSDTSYYWRIDTVTASSTITGDEWSFYTGAGSGGGDPEVTLTDDTFINGGLPNDNFGSLSTMRVTVDQRYCYLKFTVSNTGGSVNSALLDLKSYTEGFDDTTAYSVTGDWTEESLTWNNDDLVWGSSLDTNDPIAASTWYTFDVSNAITGDGTFTIGLKTTMSGSTHRWYTKESADVPVLTVYAGAPDTTPPAAPTGLAATGGDSQVTLDWNDNTEADLDGYNVYRTDDLELPFGKINASLVTPSAYTDSTVSNNTTYYYLVKALDTNSNESTSSNVDSACPQGDTTPPANPTGLSATGGNEQVTLDWNDNTEGDLDGYNVYRSTMSGSGYSKINGALVSPSDYTDSTVSNGTTYYYVVTAVDTSSNESGYSNEDSALPQSNDIYVYDITMGGYESKTNYYSATATVWIKDVGLNDIEGATVYGSWSGATKKGDDEMDTGSNGKATLTSDAVKGGGTYTFTVTNVIATGYTYNSSLNNEDYDSITLP